MQQPHTASRPPVASTSHARLASISSEATLGPHPLDSNGHASNPRAHPATAPSAGRSGQYAISSVLVDPNAPASLLPLPSLASNQYLPTSLSSLGTTFTSAGTMPRSSVTSKSVAQRRSQAPPLVVSEVRKVARTEFDTYLAEVAPAWDRWQKESLLGRDGTADLAASVNGGRTARGGVGLGIGGDEDEPPAAPSNKYKEEELPPLDGVPQIFFDPAFNLSNPRTFDLVTERIQLSPNSSPSLPQGDEDELNQRGPAFEPIPGLGPLTLNDLATDQILQEKLSHYTAVIESHLVREIGIRSSSFFSALSNLQSLHQQGEDTLAKITELQAALSSKESGVGGASKRGLDILRGQARRRGLEKIEESMRVVEEIWNGVEGVKELVENGEWVGALEVSEQIETMYYGGGGSGDGTDSKDDSPPDGSSTVDIVVSSPSVDSTATATKPHRRPRQSRINLTRVKALDGVPKKLALLRAQVAKSLEAELIAGLEHEMEVGIEDYLRLAVTGAWKRADRDPTSAYSPLSPLGLRSPASAARPTISFDDKTSEETGEDTTRERTIDRVRPMVQGLVRADGMDGAVAAWRESALREIRAMVREHLPNSETPSVEEEDAFAHIAIRSVSRGASIDLGTISEKSLSLAKKLRAMPHAAFLSLARDTYLGLLGCIEVADIHSKVLIELSNEYREAERARKSRRHSPDTPAPEDKPPAPTSSSLAVPGALEDLVRPSLTVSTSSSSLAGLAAANDDTTATDLADVVHAIAELANLRFSKVIGVRTEVHANLELEEFVEIFDASWSFVLQCEVICQRMIVGLRGVMVGQAKTFLQSFHQKRLTESAKLVENEQWTAADCPASTQAIVNLVLQSAVTDPAELLLGQRRKPSLPNGSSTEVTTNGNGGPPPASAKQVDIEGRQYFAVSAGLLALDVLADYLKVVLNCPLLTTDAMSKVVEFLKSFNSRTCQVVLGAGAMRSAGLKNITAKHLALASQALSIMISLIPYIRETLRRHLNPKQAVMLIEFDKLKRDYQEHQNEIHAKLVAIMSDRLQVHSRTLETINWEEPSARSGAPNAYMESLVKENITLHKVLSRFLQAETVMFIMSQVFGAVDSRLKEEYAKVELKSEGAKKRLLVDVTYLKTRLGELKGMEDYAPGKDLEELVNAKHLPVAARPPARTRTSSVAAAPSTPSPFASPAPTPAVEASAPAAVPDSPSPSMNLPLPSSPPPLPPSEPIASPAVTEEPAAETPLVPPHSPVRSPSPPLPLAPARSPSPLPSAPALPPAAPVAEAPPPNVPKKKTLAERLAEMARRGSGSSTPPPPTVEEPTPAAQSEQKVAVVVEPESQEAADSSTPVAEESPASQEPEASTGGSEVPVVPEDSSALEDGGNVAPVADDEAVQQLPTTKAAGEDGEAVGEADDLTVEQRGHVEEPLEEAVTEKAASSEATKTEHELEVATEEIEIEEEESSFL